jgi:hypothetical protein
MADPNSATEMGFIPQDLESIMVGRLSVYPKITPKMPVYERAHAFQINKSALTNLPVDIKLVYSMHWALSSTVPLR